MKAQRLFVAVLAVMLAGCGETPTEQKKPPVVVAQIVEGPAEGSTQNDSTEISTCIPFRGQVTQDGKVVSGATMEWYDGTAKVATGESPCISFAKDGNHTVEVRAMGAKSTPRSFRIPSELELLVNEVVKKCRTFVYDREPLRAECYTFETVKNPRGRDVKLKGWKYEDAPAAFVGGQLNVPSPLALGNRTLVAVWEVVGIVSGETACILEVRATPSLQVRVMPTDPRGTSSAAGMMAYAFAPGAKTPTDSAVVGGNDVATLVSLAFTLTGFEVHAADPLGRYHRAMLVVEQRQVDFTLEFPVVLVPSTWQIVDGGHAGKSVPVSMNLAFTRNNASDPISSFYQRDWSEALQKWAYDTAIWQKSDRPVKMAICTEAAYSEQDSTIFWGNVRSMMFWYGIELYRPATCGELADNRDIRVQFKADGDSNGGRSLSDQSGTFVVGILVFTGSDHMNSRAVAHETSHLAGVHHGCEWATVVFACSDGSMSSTNPTVHDVTYVQILYRFGDLKRELGLKYDPIVAALRGERFSKGLSPDFPPPPGQ